MPNVVVGRQFDALGFVGEREGSCGVEDVRHVDDADDHCNQARSAGARIIDEPTTHDYGEDHWADRTYRAEDLEGHQWWFIQRIRSAD